MTKQPVQNQTHRKAQNTQNTKTQQTFSKNYFRFFLYFLYLWFLKWFLPEMLSFRLGTLIGVYTGFKNMNDLVLLLRYYINFILTKASCLVFIICKNTSYLFCWINKLSLGLQKSIVKRICIFFKAVSTMV